ncbi:MAG: DJ-1/PfpI family protein [Treponema sp.]|jgi:4-methyl-5(b-hydroxyethyl)-thiazole monophosphate biosynthesis|nr:DJ-1/PfpI family protein [Treponema sp.]
MTKKALVLLAEGFEEVEAVSPIDYLRRAGIEVKAAAVGETLMVTGARQIAIRADTTLGELKAADQSWQDWDAVIVPGGMGGAANLAASGETGALLSAMARGGKLVAAICASPALVLAPLGLLAGKRFTCYPGMEKDLGQGQWSGDPVVIDGNLITSRGAGTAGLFAIAIIGKLLGEAEGEKVARSVLLKA